MGEKRKPKLPPFCHLRISEGFTVVTHCNSYNAGNIFVGFLLELVTYLKVLSLKERRGEREKEKKCLAKLQQNAVVVRTSSVPNMDSLLTLSKNGACVRRRKKASWEKE